MPSRHNPADSLSDIIENAERIERYVAGMDRIAFASNGLLRDAVERCLERVCEAAHQIGRARGRIDARPALGRHPRHGKPTAARLRPHQFGRDLKCCVPRSAKLGGGCATGAGTASG